ncbi:MAG: diacylglycerol O-acyltransferase [Myxococcota bacterium]|jgi:diacylglycerol O-acyltransferase
MSRPLLPLSAMDTAWWHMDRADNPLVINALLILEEGADVPAVIERFVERVVRVYRRFRQVVFKPSAVVSVPVWKDVEVVLTDHIQHAHIDEPGQLEDLWATVGSLLGVPLDRDQPLWSLTDIRGLGSQQRVLLFRTHHVIGDGMAMAKLLLSVCDEKDVSLPRPRGRSHRPNGAWVTRMAAHLDAGVDMVRATAELLAMNPESSSPLVGPLNGMKHIAWSEPVPLSCIQTVRDGLGGSVNDVLVAAVAGALHTTLDDPQLVDLRALVPVYLHPLDAPIPDDLGNHFAPIFLRLPSSTPDAVGRLEQVRRRTNILKGGQMPLVTAAGVHVIGHAPQFVEDVAVDHFASRASLVLTNMPGPRRAVHVAGARIDDIVFFVPQPASIGVGLSLFSYNENVRLGVSADIARDVSPIRLVQAFATELKVLEAAAKQVRTV